MKRIKFCDNCSNDSDGEEKIIKCGLCVRKSFCETCMKDHLRYHDDANPRGVSRDGIARE